MNVVVGIHSLSDITTDETDVPVSSLHVLAIIEEVIE